MTTLAAEQRRTIQQVADWLGLPKRTVEAWPRRYGAEAELGGPGKWSLQAFARLAIHIHRTKSEERDPLLASGDDSPELERYRAARASLAELELSRKRGDVVDAAATSSMLGGVAEVIRNCGEQLGREFGESAREILESALSNYQREIDQSEFFTQQEVVDDKS